MLWRASFGHMCAFNQGGSLLFSTITDEQVLWYIGYECYLFWLNLKANTAFFFPSRRQEM